MSREQIGADADTHLSDTDLAVAPERHVAGGEGEVEVASREHALKACQAQSSIRFMPFAAIVSRRPPQVTSQRMASAALPCDL